MRVLRAFYESWYDAIWGREGINPTFAVIFAHLWRNRGKIIAVALAAALIGFVTAKMQTPRYVSTLQIIPNIDDKVALERILNPGGNSLANLLSTPFGKSERVTPFQQFSALMLSEEVVAELERRLHLLRHIYPEYWDQTRNAWKPGTGGLGNAIKRLFNLPAPDHPDLYMLQRYLQRNVGISEDRLLATQTISYTDTNPEVALRVLENLYAVAEERLIARDRQLSQSRLKQANQNLGGTILQSNREALAGILTRYNLQVIETNVGSPYAAVRLSGPKVLPYPTAPNVLQYLFAGLSTGLLTIIALLTIRVLRK